MHGSKRYRQINTIVNDWLDCYTGSYETSLWIVLKDEKTRYLIGSVNIKRQSKENVMAKKTITLKEFADELELRLKGGKSVDCCHDELINLAKIIRTKLPNEKIEVDWKN
jgi:hypothetical protein